MNIKKYWIPLILSVVIISSANDTPWGFYGHRKINRIAVFSLPPEMIVFYKKHIEFITEHAVDPDKRRYATPNEGVRHYIDIDHWGENPFDAVPKKIIAAILKYGDLSVVYDTSSFPIVFNQTEDSVFLNTTSKKIMNTKLFWYKEQWAEIIGPDIYAGEWEIPLYYFDDSLNIGTLHLKDNFVEYGIVPYHLQTMQNRLEKAFYEKDAKSILRTSAELGHYIGDASVPLHTTENYNGQMTNQIGIHAFWESRIPELFSDNEFDLFVGKCEYIADKTTYFWNIVEESHGYLEDVLSIEKELSNTYASDEQFCFDDRLGRTIKTQCEPYSRAYMDAMDGMVEARMKRAIISTASAWYTAWIDAGSPDLSALADVKFSKEEIDAFNNIGINSSGKTFKSRSHEH